MARHGRIASSLAGRSAAAPASLSRTAVYASSPVLEYPNVE